MDTIIKFTLYSYSFKQIMSVEKPSTACLFFDKLILHFWSLDGVDGSLDSPPSVRTFVPIFPNICALKFSDFWSLDQLVVETLGVVFVRTFVRTFVRPSRVFSETAHYFFMKLYS